MNILAPLYIAAALVVSIIGDRALVAALLSLILAASLSFSFVNWADSRG